MEPGGASAREISLRVTRRISRLAWDWRLEGSDGATLAEHSVRIDTNAAEWQWAAGLEEYLRLRRVSWRPDSEQQLVRRIGLWLTTALFGNIAEIIEPSSAALTIHLTGDDLHILQLPLELISISGIPVWQTGISIRYLIEGARTRERATSPGDPFRLLGIFSLPVGSTALSLRRERQVIAQIVEQANELGRWVEFRPVQFSGTESYLARIIGDRAGWDAIHVSSHGLPGGVVIEADDGSPQVVGIRRLTSLLGNANSRLKLVTLSSCSSASAATDGLMASDSSETQSSRSPQIVATALAVALGCSVVGMRYSVADADAITLAEAFYKFFLLEGQEVSVALKSAVGHVAAERRRAGTLFVCTPLLITADPGALTAHPAQLAVAANQDRTSLRSLPIPAEQFVGRVSEQSQIMRILLGQTRETVALLLGMPGIGKTAGALESAHLAASQFASVVWIDLHAPDFRTALEEIARDLASERAQQTATRAASPGTLYVLDSLEVLLSGSGQWATDQDKELVRAILALEGPDRVIVTSRYLPEDLPDHVSRIVFSPISVGESRILTYEILSVLLADGSGTRGAADLDLAFIDSYATLPAGGHPGLLQVLVSVISKLREALGTDSVPGGFWWCLEEGLQQIASTMAAQGDMRIRDSLAEIQHWIERQMSALSPSESIIFAAIAYLADTDRLAGTVKGAIPEVLAQDSITVSDEEIDSALKRSCELGLAVVGDLIAMAVEIGPVNLTDRESGLYVVQVHPAIAGYAPLRMPADLRRRIDVAIADTYERFLHENREEQNPFAGAMQLSAIKYRMRVLDWNAVLRLVLSFSSREQSEDARLRMSAVVGEVIKHLPEGELLGRAIEVRDALGQMTFLGSHESFYGNLVAARRAELDVAEAQGDHLRCEQTAKSLGHVLIAMSRLDEAADLAVRRREHCELAGTGPWTMIDSEVDYLVAAGSSRPDAQTLENIQRCVERTDALQMPEDGEPSGPPETVDPAEVKRRLAEIGMVVASRIGLPARALQYNRVLQELMLRESPGAVDILRQRVHEAQLLNSLGRSKEALDILRRCRDQLSQLRNPEAMLAALVLQANLESSLGRYDEAMHIMRDAFPLQYSHRAPRNIARLHFNFANYSYSDGRRDLATAHRIICCLLRVEGDPANFAEALDRLYLDMQGDIGTLEVPALVAVCSVIENDLDLDILPFVEELITFDADQMIGKIMALAAAEEAKMIVSVRQMLDQYSDLVAEIIAFIGEPKHLRVGHRARIDEEIMRLFDRSAMSPQLSRALAEVLDGQVAPASSALPELDPVSQTVLEMIADGASHSAMHPEIDYGRRCAVSLMKRQMRATSVAELGSGADRSAKLASVLRTESPGARPAREGEVSASPQPPSGGQEDFDLRPASEMRARASALTASGDVAGAAQAAQLCLYYLWAQLERFIASAGASDDRGKTVKAAADLLNELLLLADVAIAVGAHRVIKRSLMGAIAIMKLLGTPLNPGISRCAAEIWKACRAEGSLSEGREYLEIALQGSIEQHGEMHPATIHFHYQMAYMLTTIGDLSAALKHAQLAVENGRSVLGMRHSAVGAYLGQLGIIYRLMGDHRHARPCLSEAIELLEGGGDKTREELAHALNALGLLSRDAGEFHLAIDYFRRALDMVRDTSWDSAKIRVSVRGNLATALWKSGDFDDALRLQLEVLSEKREMLQPHDVEIAITLGNIGLMYDSADDVDQAIRYHREALSLLRQGYGDDHPDALRTAFNLGRSLRRSMQPEEGTRLLEWLAARQPTGSRGDQFIYAAEGEIRPKSWRRRRRRD